MTEEQDQDAKDPQLDSGSKTFVNKFKDKKIKTQKPLTKIILRRLPPTMTEEAFLEQVSPIPEHDYLYFSKPDPSLGNNVYSRAYINFVNVDDIYLFRDKFDGYVFVDDKEYVAIVEYAPFQRIPKRKKKKDPKCGTIESDPVYQEFLQGLNKETEIDNQPKLEYSYPVNDSNDKKVQSTPLLEYLAARKQSDKRGRDERRRRENDKRKMRIERKTKEGSIKKPDDLSEEETPNNNCDCDWKSNQYWFGEKKNYYKGKLKSKFLKADIKCIFGSDELISTDSDWDSQFPALSMKTYKSLTLATAKNFDRKQQEFKNSGGDNIYDKEEEIGDNEVKKIKSREFKDGEMLKENDKEKIVSKTKEDGKSDIKDGIIFESKTYREQRRVGSNSVTDKKKNADNVKKETVEVNDEKVGKREKKDKIKESPREQKIKKYSDARKERIKQNESMKSDKQAAINKIMSSEGKKSANYDDIKPFTQLPQVKTHDLTKIIDGMDRRFKLDENHWESVSQDDLTDDKVDKNQNEVMGIPKTRTNSLGSEDSSTKEESSLRKQKSLEERNKSSDREGSEEKDKGDSAERRAERRIRNKDRPSLVIYQPGMGKFSKQRLAKEKEPQSATVKSVNDSEKKDT